MKIYLVGLRNGFAAAVAYRANLAFSVAMTVVGDLVIPLVSFLIYNSGAEFAGWGMYEILLIQGVFILSKGIAGTFFFGMVWSSLSMVADGTYDLLLIKPASTLLVSLSNNFDIDSIGSILTGVVLTCVACVKTGRSMNLPLFLLLFAFGLVVMLGFALLMSGSVFKWVGNSRIYEIFDAVSQFGNYPASIYPKTLLYTVSYILPVALIGFYPAAALMGKPVPGLKLLLLSGSLFLALCFLFWRVMLKNYTSAGG